MDTKHRPELSTLTPLTVTPANCELVLGVKFRWAKETARALGVPILRHRGKSMIVAAPLVDAIARANAAQQQHELTDEEQRSAMRAQLGLVRRAG